MSSFSKATKQSRRFIRTFRKATRLQEIAAITADYAPSPLAIVFDEVYEAYKRQTGGYGPPRNVAPLERSAQTASSEALTRLEQRLTWLATIASSAPSSGSSARSWASWTPFTDSAQPDRRPCARLLQASPKR
jgi:biopolymer transport protein TolQ